MSSCEATQSEALGPIGAGAALTVVPIRAVIELSGYQTTFFWFGEEQTSRAIHATRQSLPLVVIAAPMLGDALN